MTWLALDIGGANLKAADGLGWARSVPFDLSGRRRNLAGDLQALIEAAPVCTRLAVTMTGELCDAFRSKSDGVLAILDAVTEAAGRRPIAVYLVDGRLVFVEQATSEPLLAAASNWHVLAKFACRFAEQRVGLLIDVGSTTTDIIPLVHGRVAAQGTSDTDRLLSGELAYTGVCRTPVCAVTPTLPYRGADCPVAAEWFATTADAYVLLEELPPEPEAAWTADGRPLAPPFARERLARMVCADARTFDERNARVAAAAIRTAQLAQLRSAAERATSRLPTPIEAVIVSGAGEFLARRLAAEAWPRTRVVSLAAMLGREVSLCAPAHALAVFAHEMEGAVSRTRLSVVKVGGSLLTSDDFPGRLRTWLTAERTARGETHFVLIAGGGKWVDAIRRVDAASPLGEERAHWLCISIMDVTAGLVAAMLPEIVTVETWEVLSSRVQEPGVTILKPSQFLRDVEPNAAGTRLPANWSVTSDSIAGRLAIVLAADELCLLKAAAPPARHGDEDWLDQLAAAGYVDEFLPTLRDELPTCRIEGQPPEHP